MPYYEDDEVLAELHDEMYSRQEPKPKQINALSGSSRIWIIVIFGVIAILIAAKKISFTNGLIAAGILLVILYFLFGRGNQTLAELTYIECMIRLYDLLEFLQRHPIGKYPQIPPGEIRVRPVGKKQWYDGKAFKRSFGVDIYDREIDVTDHFFAEVDIYTGDIITFRAAPEGVRGDEKKDIKIMPSPDMLMQKRKDEFFAKRK